MLDAFFQYISPILIGFNYYLLYQTPVCILYKSKSMFLGRWRAEENLGGVGAQETVMRIYDRKKSIFN